MARSQGETNRSCDRFCTGAIHTPIGPSDRPSWSRPGAVQEGEFIENRLSPIQSGTSYPLLDVKLGLRLVRSQLD